MSTALHIDISAGRDSSPTGARAAGSAVSNVERGPSIVELKPLADTATLPHAATSQSATPGTERTTDAASVLVVADRAGCSTHLPTGAPAPVWPSMSPVRL